MLREISRVNEIPEDLQIGETSLELKLLYNASEYQPLCINLTLGCSRCGL
jgi:hypothetical protein